jgi:hypothetical protein
MKVHWLLPFKIENISQLKEVNLASIRLRLGIVSQNNSDSSFEISAGEDIENNPDILIIGKLKSTKNQSVKFWIDKIKLAKQNGAKIVIDYTDNYLDQHDSVFYKPFYDALIGLTDKAVTSSNHLKLNLKKYFNGYIEIIEDAIEVPIFKPYSSKKDMVNILWFGHASNLKYLIKFIEQSKEFKALTNIYALTNEQGITIANQSKVDMPNNLNVQLGLWSIDAMINTAKFCDLCIIPSDLNDERKAGVSSNRLITSLALGLPTAADKLDSYNEFDNYFIDIRSKEFEALMEKPDSFHDQVLRAQEKIIPNFTQKAISQKWIRFFSSLNQSH